MGTVREGDAMKNGDWLSLTVVVVVVLLLLYL
jgi:hypothetical protein